MLDPKPKSDVSTSAIIGIWLGTLFVLLVFGFVDGLEDAFNEVSLGTRAKFLLVLFTVGFVASFLIVLSTIRLVRVMRTAWKRRRYENLD